MSPADRREEALREEFDLLCLGVPSAERIAAVRGDVVFPECPNCGPLRRLIEHLIAGGIDALDAIDAAGVDREDDEDEIVSEDDGVVDAMTLARVIR